MNKDLLMVNIKDYMFPCIDVGMENALNNIVINVSALEIAAVWLTGSNTTIIMTNLTDSNSNLIKINAAVTSGNSSLVTVIATLTAGNSSLVTLITTLTSTNSYVVKIATSATVYNVAITASATEYSQALLANTKRFLIKLRSTAANADLWLCYSAGASGLTYFTIPAGSSYDEDELNLAAATLYMQSPLASQTAEIVDFV